MKLLLSIYKVFPRLVPFLSLGLIGCSTGNIVEKNQDTTTQPIVIEAVAALGQLNPKGDIISLAAPSFSASGTPRISKLLVSEGDQIVTGQLLAVFDNRDRVLADLLSAEASQQRIQQQIVMKKKEISRYQSAEKEGAVPIVLVEEKQQELIRLEGEKNQNIYYIQGLKADLNQTQLKSPIDGLVLRVNTFQGERPDSKGILEIGASQAMEALIEVYESDIDRISIGQNVVLVSENGGFDKPLNGTVSLISPQVRQRRVLSTDPTGDADARIVEVRVTLDNFSAAVVSNFTGMKVIARFKPL